MKRTAIALAAAAFALGLATAPAYAADAAAGEAKAKKCVACHGKTGISKSKAYPNLAGQKEKYLKDQMKAFRDKKRKNGIMNAQMRKFSDDDIANMAAYYASLGCPQ
ncbi:MAG: cytochrome c [Magnetococcales bacterium]|nr:cytochrome c [Magnetococcales bacterium]